MLKSISKTELPEERVFSKIHIFRDQKVLLDEDLAEMYGVETKVLNQAVKRNLDRFPDDFMFQLTENEYHSLKSQIVTSKNGRGGRRYHSFAFTEQGVAMLSSVNSTRLNESQKNLISLKNYWNLLTRIEILLAYSNKQNFH